MADLVWGWIGGELRALEEAGEDRLASIMLDIPGLVLDEEHERVDALMPEVLARARAAKRPWLEVYFRHWHLQSRILSRCEAETALGDAVALVDFAHRDDTKECPQSICALQDLAVCYGLIDGPGYAEERKAVANELLPTLEPERGCFSCLSMEYSGAVADQGRPAEALAYLDRQVLRALEAGRASTISHVRTRRVELLLESGRPDEALEEAERGLADADVSVHKRRELNVLAARALVALGRADEIGGRLPEDRHVLASPSLGVQFAEVLAGLVDAGVIANDVELGQRLRALVRVLVERKNRWRSVQAAVIEAKLAIARGAFGMARRALETGRDAAMHLRDPARGHGVLAEVEAVLARARAAAKETAKEGASTEEPTLEDRLNTLDEEPIDDRRRAPKLAEWTGILEALGHPEEAVRELEAALAVDPPDPLAFALLGHRRRGERTAEPLEALIRGVLARSEDPALLTTAAFLRALRAASDGALEEAEKRFDEVLTREPTAINSRFGRARVRAQRGDHAGALADLDELVRLTSDRPEARDPEVPWRRMTAATIVGDWAKVRAVAAELGMELPGDGPVEASWGLVRIEHRVDGEPRQHLAHRLGPAHARIIEVSPPSDAQRFRDVVAFFPSPLPEEASDDEGERKIHTFAEEAVLSRGGLRGVALDGAHPGDDRLAELERAIGALGGELQRWSPPDLQLEREDGTTVRRYYGVAAVPMDTTNILIDELVRGIVKGGETPHLHVVEG